MTCPGRSVYLLLYGQNKPKKASDVPAELKQKHPNGTGQGMFIFKNLQGSKNHFAQNITNFYLCIGSDNFISFQFRKKNLNIFLKVYYFKIYLLS